MSGEFLFARKLFLELASFCPDDPDVHWLAVAVHKRAEGLLPSTAVSAGGGGGGGGASPFPSRFVTAFASMSALLVEGAPAKAVASAADCAALSMVAATRQNDPAVSTVRMVDRLLWAQVGRCRARSRAIGSSCWAWSSTALTCCCGQ